MGARKVHISTVFAGQNVGVKQVAYRVWMVSFMDYDLGFFDDETGRIECAENPYGAKGRCRTTDSQPGRHAATRGWTLVCGCEGR